MEGPPNGVPTQRGGIHGNPVTTQHHGTRHTGKPVESSKEHTYQGEREAGEAAATDLQSSVITAKQALQACGQQAGPVSV